MGWVLERVIINLLTSITSYITFCTIILRVRLLLTLSMYMIISWSVHDCSSFATASLVLFSHIYIVNRAALLLDIL